MSSTVTSMNNATVNDNHSYQKLQKIEENDCIPPSIPTRDKHGFDCCKLPPEPFPHKAIYEEFCSPVYFGVMEEHPNGRFCRLSSTQYRKSIPCESGWVMFYEGYNQFCYKAFTITSSKDAIDISSKKSDPCQNKHKRASLVRVPNENINMFLFVKVLNGALNLSCSTTDANTYYYYIGLHRNDFNWQWRPYHEKSYSHLEEQAQQLLDYLNSPHSQHIWSDGTRIFADGWDNANDITTNVVISNCGMWRDFNNSITNFKYDGKHVPNQGFICAYQM